MPSSTVLNWSREVDCDHDLVHGADVPHRQIGQLLEDPLDGRRSENGATLVRTTQVERHEPVVQGHHAVADLGEGNEHLVGRDRC